jgi:hypothetical protein
MMEAVSNFETSVNFYQTTWRNISEESNFHTRRRENLKVSAFFPPLCRGPTYLAGCAEVPTARITLS